MKKKFWVAGATACVLAAGILLVPPEAVEAEMCIRDSICTDETRECYGGGLVRSIGERAKEETVAHNLYALLREFDDLGAQYIYSEGFPEDHLGQAIMNRLSKAAGYRIQKV